MIPRLLLRNSITSRVWQPRNVTAWPQHSLLCPTSYATTTKISSSRFYSSKIDETNGDNGASATSEPTAGASSNADGKEKDEIEAKNKEIIDLKDKYLRSVAEFRNLQDRTARDVAAARDFAITRFAKDLLDSVDNFDRALSTVPATSLAEESTNKELKDLHSGLKMTESILLQTLAKNGLERFDPSEKGDKFDPNLHEATFMTKMEGKEDGTCFNTISKGFKLNGRVVRAAKVGVVKNN